MPIDAILQGSRAGLAYERLRLEAASRNIAMANVPLPAQAAAPQTVEPVGEGSFGSIVAHPQGDAVSKNAVREVYEPNHPLADSEGMVRYPDVDLVHEMATLLTASRGYEANVRAFNMLRGMTLQALEIGAK